MFFDNIKDVIKEKNIVCFSPHFDDFLFFLGGYFLELKVSGLLETKNFTNVSVFSRTNYLEGDTQGNKDTGVKRVQYATGIRIVEDWECMDALFGAHNYKYIALGEPESLLRGKPLSEGDGEMEMAYGSLETMDDKDKEACGRICKFMEEIAMEEDTAIVLPLAMKGHMDHFVTRRAGEIVMQKNVKAEFYFGEDKPYAGLLTENEKSDITAFIKKYKLEDRAFKFNPNEELEMAFKYYPSQVDDVYDVGINTRSKQLKELYGKKCEIDRILKYNK